MKISEWRKKRTFGPVVEHLKDGSFRALCTWCAFRVGNACTYVKPSRQMFDPENTPEWCELREGMIRDAKEMAGGNPVIAESHADYDADADLAAVRRRAGA